MSNDTTNQPRKGGRRPLPADEKLVPLRVHIRPDQREYIRRGGARMQSDSAFMREILDRSMDSAQ